MNFLWPLLPAVIGTAFLALVFRPKKATPSTPTQPESATTRDDAVNELTKIAERIRSIIKRPTTSEEKVSEINSVIAKVRKEEHETVPR